MNIIIIIMVLYAMEIKIVFHYCCVAICLCAVVAAIVGVPDDTIGGNGVRAPVISGGSLLVLFFALAAGTNPRSPGV